MKNLKYIITILIFTLISINSNAQSSPFHGTWEWENGNQIFRVNLWLDEYGATSGHFEMVEVNNNIETTIYTSDKPYNSAMSQHWHPVISAGWNGNHILSGRIMDNSLDYEDPQYDGLTLWTAWLEMKTISYNPTKAKWTVQWYDLIPDNILPLNVPTDIIMTKVN